MRDSKVFLAELWIGKCYTNHHIERNLTLLFRIGRNVAQHTVVRDHLNGIVTFNLTLQLNTDKAALDTQRCSLTITAPGYSQADTVGIAIMSLPKEYSVSPRKFKLAQCMDKSAEIDLALRVIPIDQTSDLSGKTSSFGANMSQSSFRSIMEMNDFDKKIISPPNLFEIPSELSEVSNNNYLLPPKPRSSRERKANPLTASINSQAIVEDQSERLQNQCECLRKLLKVEMEKNKESTALIQKLVQALEGSTLPATEYQSEAIMAGSVKKVGQSQQFTLSKDFSKRLDDLQGRNKQLALENELLSKQNGELTELILKLGDYVDEKDASSITESQIQMESLRKLDMAEKGIAETNMKLQKYKGELHQLELELRGKERQIQQLKVKLKVQAKPSSIKNGGIDKKMSPKAKIRQIMERSVADRKQLLRQLARCSRQNESYNDGGLMGRIKQKVQKCFTSLLGKKNTKEGFINEKLELLKEIEGCLRQFSNKMIEY